MRWPLVVMIGILVATAWAPPAVAAETVVAFDPSRGEFPEGVVFDRRGDMYVSLAPLGEIRRRGADGSWSTFARVDPGTGGLAVLGLAADARGTIYAAAPTNAPEWHGVVAVSRDGVARRLPGTEQIAFPNALAFDHRGNLYVTDSIRGAVWRVSRSGEVQLWAEHEALAGMAIVNPFPLGANGIAYSRGRLYVANTEKMQVVEIPISRSGAAGPPRIMHAFGGAGDFLDGITADPRGNLYVLLAAASELVRIDRSGRVTTLAGAGDGLSMPASLTFGARRTLYITNFSLPDFVPEPMPGVVALGLCSGEPRVGDVDGGGE